MAKAAARRASVLEPIMAFDAEAVAAAVDAHPDEAAEALKALNADRVLDLNPDGLAVAAKAFRKTRGQVLVPFLEQAGAVDAFGLALQARGVALQAVEVPFDATHWPPETPNFLARARAFRCRILVDGSVRGSGVVVGPSSVLTAWHVIAVAAPTEPQEPALPVSVLLSDGRHIDAVPPGWGSVCGDDEYLDKLPADDAAVDQRHDLALLRLKEPVGLHLAPAELNPDPRVWRNPGAMVLVHYPEGQDPGIAFGQFAKLESLTARWGHTAVTRGGSSGGACFDTRLQLAGVHQGRADPRRGRMIPATVFPPELRERLAEDQAPDTVWSLSGAVDGVLVVGRENFFRGFAAASRRAGRVRGLWIQRSDIRGDTTGLPFTFAMLERMVARTPGDRVVRVDFDQIAGDVGELIRTRARQAGVDVPMPEPAPGAGPEHTEPEAAIADRIRRLVRALGAAASGANLRLWFYFEHPAGVFSDEPRWALDAFVDEAMKHPRLRVVLAGYEALQMPGAKFQNVSEADGEGAPGLFVESVTDFGAAEVDAFIRRAAADLGQPLDEAVIVDWRKRALFGLPAVNERYAWPTAADVAERLRPELRRLADQGRRP